MNYIVTGLMCSGKSTFLEIARSNHFKTLCADELVTKLYDDSRIINKLQNQFKGYDLSYNTKEFIKDFFFKSDSNKMKIESIIHPEVHKIINCELKNSENLIVEVPPLIENYKLLKDNKSVFIDTNENARSIRYLKRRAGNKLSDFKNINDMQLEYTKIKMVCDLIIDNNNDVDSFSKYFKKHIIKS